MRKAVLALLLALAGTAAHAHADVPLVDATVRLEPGAAFELPMALHFHRLAVRYRVHGGEDAGLALHVVRDGTGRTPDPGRSGEAHVLLTEPLVGRGSLSRLVPCCLGESYTDLTLVVRHDGAAPATVDLRAWAVHDEFAVVAQRAEAGAFGVPGALFAALGTAALVTTGRVVRRFPRYVPAPPDGTTVRPRLLWASGALLVLASIVATTLGVAGAVRYGGGPVAGMIAILADVNVPGGPFGSRGAFLLAVLLLVWVGAIAAWIVGVAQGTHLATPWTVRLGTAFAVLSVVAGTAMAWTYGGSWVPLALGAILAVPIGTCAVWLARDRGANEIAARSVHG